VDDRDLIAQASRALEHAYAPYSGIKVGACAVSESGETYSACNVENASYGLTMCAERAALYAAVAAGHRKMKKVAIVAQGMDCPMPCGACLQVMNEFGVEQVLVGTLDGGIETFNISSLLPKPFSL
jgi:cytidine deaminase